MQARARAMLSCGVPVSAQAAFKIQLAARLVLHAVLGGKFCSGRAVRGNL